jgi:hypothetical protein
MIHEQRPLRFECTGCGACCVGLPGHVVETGAREREAIRLHLGVSRSWFRRRYLSRIDDGEWGLRLQRNGRCVFLGGDDRCRIYAVRPLQCRTFPWWPELLASNTTWAAEARRCEGMNRGAVVPLSRIRAALKRRAR